MPTVSIVMPVYNGERFLAQAITSVIGQSMTDWELLVIDDGSTDGSRRQAQRFADPRIRVLANDGNRGLVYTRNRGLDEARGRYIAFLDADDVARPHRLQRQISYLERHADVGGVGSWVQPIDASDAPAPYVWKLPGAAELTRSLLLFRGQFNTSSFTCKASLAREVRFRDAVQLAEDYDFYIRLAHTTRLCNLPEVLIDCRIHDRNTTRLRRDALRQCLDTINRGQLSELGIAPSTDDLAIHRHLEWLDRPASPTLLNNVEDWLLRILAANRALRVYPEPMLGRAAAERWFRVCEHAAVLGFSDALLRCFRSPLIRHLREPFPAQAKFAAKCLLRRAPRPVPCT